MDATLSLFARLALIAVALVFDLLSGLHDAANSIATVVFTRVLRGTTTSSLSLTSAFTGSKLRPEGIEMSRGHGKWERLIMQTLDQREAFYLLELFPPGRGTWGYRSDLRIRALRRAARNLGNAGKVRRFYDARDRQRRLVIARPSVGVETLRRCLPRMSDRRRIELDLRLRDEESAASLTETDNELHLGPYRQRLNEHGLTDEQEAYEQWLDEQHWVEISDDDQW